jgi:hypothetical protein
MQIALQNGVPIYVDRELYSSRCCCACSCLAEDWAARRFPCCGELQQYSVSIPSVIEYSSFDQTSFIRFSTSSVNVLAEESLFSNTGSILVSNLCVYSSGRQSAKIESRTEDTDWFELDGGFVSVRISAPFIERFSLSCVRRIDLVAGWYDALTFASFEFIRPFSPGDTTAGSYTLNTDYGSYSASAS